MARLTCWMLLAASVLLAGFGCSKTVERQVAVFPVDGQLSVGGQPAVGAVVTFHAQNADASSQPITAKVRDDGHFVAVQPDGANGLPEGEFSLTAIWLEGEKDRLAGKYSDPAQPLSKITVKPGINLLPPIRLP